MKLIQEANGDALCPVCALSGIVTMLEMPPDSLVIGCQYGHQFDTTILSRLARGRRYEKISATDSPAVD